MKSDNTSIHPPGSLTSQPDAPGRPSGEPQEGAADAPRDRLVAELLRRLEAIEWLLREERKARERELAELTGRLNGVRDQIELRTTTPPDWARALFEQVQVVGTQVAALSEQRSRPARHGPVGPGDDRFGHGQRDGAERAGLSPRLAAMERGIEAAARRFTRIEASLAELGRRLDRLEQGVRGMGVRVEQSVGVAAERIGVGLRGLEGRIDGASGRLDGLYGRLDGLEGRVSGLAGRIDGIGNPSPEVVVKIVETVSSSIVKTIDHIVEETTRQTEQVYHHITAQERNPGETPTRSARVSAEAVTEQLTAVHEDIQRRITDTHADLLKHLETRDDNTVPLVAASQRQQREINTE